MVGRILSKPRGSPRAIVIKLFAFVFAAALTFGPTNAHALMKGGTFDIFFDESADGDIDWMGSFISDSSGAVTSFITNIGTCSQAIQCTYVITQPGPFTFDGTFLTGVAGVIDFNMLFFNGTSSWNTQNLLDTVTFRSGSYTVAMQIPEPSTLALFGTGVAALGFLCWRRRRKHPIQAP